MFIFIDPVAKPRMTRSDKWKNRECVMRYRAFSDQINSERSFIEKMVEDVFTSGALNITFTIPVPKSWSKKKQMMMCGKRHTQKPDLDNLVKAVMDSVFPDSDSFIHEIHAKKFWGSSGSIEVS